MVFAAAYANALALPKGVIHKTLMVTYDIAFGCFNFSWLCW